MKRAKQPAKGRRTGQPDNLLDLNRSLSNYAYHPKGGKRPPRAPLEEPKPQRPLWKRIMLWVLGVTISVLLVVGGWVGYKLLANEIRVFGWSGVLSLLHPAKLKGEDQGRVNILLAGNSADDPNHGGANLTDSIMLLSVDTKHNTAFMLSIPRDFYVDIPGYGHAKINEAFQDGEQGEFSEAGYAKGGMGLLEKTVSEITGLPVHYYALVDYSAVRQAVDAVGGITVNISSTDPRGLYDPSPDLNNHYQPLVKLPNGPNKINGVQALGLARARGDHYGSYGYGLSDFERTKNQRLILLGLKDKVISAGTLTNPIKLGELFDSFGNNVKTDMTLGEARRLYDIVKNIPDSKISSVGLNDVNGDSLLQGYTTSHGQSALIPATGLDDYTDIQAYLAQITAPPPDTSNKKN